MAQFTHLDQHGRVRMVDVGGKGVSSRQAVARAVVSMQAATFEKIVSNQGRKGNVLETARIAGIMAAKQTHLLIPMCHPIQIRHVQVDFYPDKDAGCFEIRAAVRADDRTGVEMEAMTAASVAALTVYDMCKSHDRAMTISEVCLVEKSGGKSGHFVRSPESSQDSGA
ncbi:MAG: cyclic pyranopterin monophosphate synthase MoaC [Desulfosalsimonas sp.]|uniref:cyclic pyranopterin monophosphate synthase MoaC n=1 Tax=Desulfosalsimonas sp. TaxID=3073848 RepID=UPI0039707BB4